MVRAHTCAPARREKETSPRGSDLDLPAALTVSGITPTEKNSGLSSSGPWPSVDVSWHGGSPLGGCQVGLGAAHVAPATWPSVLFVMDRSSKGPDSQPPTAFQCLLPSPHQKQRCSITCLGGLSPGFGWVWESLHKKKLKRNITLCQSEREPANCPKPAASPRARASSLSLLGGVASPVCHPFLCIWSPEVDRSIFKFII